MENFSPQIIRQVAKELCELTKEPPEGIKISYNDEDITDIKASIEGPGNKNYTLHFLLQNILLYLFVCFSMD